MKPRSTKPSHNSIYQLLFLSLLGLSTFCAQVDASEYNVTVAPGKPGTCPANTETVTTGRNCTTECRSDTDCGGNKKCCPEGCGMSCRTPDDKPGSCPVSVTGISSLGLCRDTCQLDSECDGPMKCCRNGCNHLSCSKPSA